MDSLNRVGKDIQLAASPPVSCLPFEAIAG
jgi:hypothetical protein